MAGETGHHPAPFSEKLAEDHIVSWSNPNDIVFTPFMGIGSEVFGAVELGRKGIGIELKNSYFNQAVKNLLALNKKQEGLF